MTVPTDERRPIERRLESALRDTALRNVPDTAAPPGIRSAPATPVMGRRGWRVAAAGLAAAAVTGIALVVAGTNNAPRPAPIGSRPPTQHHRVPAARVVVGEFCDNFVPRGCTGYRNGPLWPFASYTQVQQWRAQHKDEAATAWQYDAQQVGNRYLHDVLRLTGLSLISYARYPIRGRVAMGVMAVDVGYRVHGLPHRTGSILLARYGPDKTYPWEVVGPVRSAGFAITAPPSARNAADPMQVTGRSARSNASVRVTVVTGSGAVAGTGTATANASGHWSTEINWNAPRGMLAVVATSGGTPARPQQFAIRGVRAG